MDFIYVVAYIPDGDSLEGGDPIAFKHWVIRDVKDSSAAYTKGMQKLDDKIKGKRMNNYVIPINGKLLNPRKNGVAAQALRGERSCNTCRWLNHSTGDCTCKTCEGCGVELKLWKAKKK